MQQLLLLLGLSAQLAQAAVPSYCIPGEITLAMLHGTNYCNKDQIMEEEEFLRQIVPYFVQKKISSLPDLIFHQWNVSLGLVFMETCYQEAMGAEIAGRVRSAWTREMQRQPCNLTTWVDKDPIYLVHGTVGGWSSALTQVMSFKLQNEAIPQVGTECSSDSLSDKSRFPNVVRLVSPDSYQATVIIDLLKHFNWTYIGLVYDPGNLYNTNIALQLSSSLPEQFPRACLAFIIPLTPTTDGKDVLATIKKQTNLKALVWLKNIGSSAETVNSLKAIGEEGIINIFVDGNFNANSYINSSFTIYFQLFPTPDLMQWYLNLTYADLSNMYNGARMYNLLMNCSTCNCCYSNSTRKISQASTLTPSSIVAPVSRMLDAFLAYAYAIDEIAKSDCKQSLEPQLNKTSLSTCITGPKLLKQLYRMNFTGYTGQVKLDSIGNGPAAYVVLYQRTQQVSSSVTVGVWNSDSGLSLNQSLIVWPGDRPDQVPISVCSLPCGNREYRIQVNKCCWVCKPCNSDEIVASNGSACVKCESLTWPSANSSSCEQLALTVLRPSDISGAAFISVALLGSIVSIATAIFFVIKSNEPLLKASSLELSAFQQIGIQLGFINVALFFGEPSPVTCNIQASLYHFSLSMVYAALLTKSARIYRVFVGSTRGAGKLRFTGRRPVVVMTITVCLLQVILLLCVLSAKPIQPVKLMLTQKSNTKPSVEYQCDYFSSSQWIPYALNLLLMLVTCSLAVRIRSLPDNFHDSKCILAFTACATFVWIAFIPSLVTLTSLTAAANLLVFVLLFTNLFALSILFLPKIYAVIFDRADLVKNYNASMIGTMQDERSNRTMEY